MESYKMNLKIGKLNLVDYQFKGCEKIVAWLLVPLIIAAIAGIAYLFFALVQFLWNISIAPMFDVKEITWWQALCLVVLAKLLIGKIEKQKKNVKGKQVHSINQSSDTQTGENESLYEK